jgi:PAT family beta-lactamase induction signal transducer AmpG
MGFAKEHWVNDQVLVSFMAMMEVLEVLYFVAALTLAMRMCHPAIAATQFTIYMAVSNFGRPAGAMLAAGTAGAGAPEWLYWSLAIIWGLTFLIVLKARYPGKHGAEREAATSLPGEEQPAPAFV